MTSADKELRLAIVGGCQVVGLREAACRLAPHVQTDIWHVGVHPLVSDEALVTELRSYDIVITQISQGEGHDPLSLDALRSNGPPCIYLPTFAFNGLHPDLTYLHEPQGIIPGVDGDYHSIIIACAYLIGLDPERASTLFNSFVFRTLGYYENYRAACVATATIYADAGFDVEPLFSSWKASVGTFMYSINHPHILVLLDLCRAALQRLGVATTGFNDFTQLDDALYRHTVFPVYPELAMALDLNGSNSVLMRESGPGSTHDRAIPITEYIKRSYESYAGIDHSRILQGSHQLTVAYSRLKRALVGV